MDFAALIYHRQAFLDGQWWLPLSAQIAHFNSFHALANVAGALLLWNLFRPWLQWQQQMLALTGGVLGVALVVVGDVHCDYYAGASGALYGWAAGGATVLAIRHRRTSSMARWMALALWLGLAMRLLMALWWEASPALWGFPVYQPAHIAGAGGGVVAALCHLFAGTGHSEASQDR